MGSMARAMEGERARAQAWQGSLAGTTAQGWATELVASYDDTIQWLRQREDEERLRLR